jgi:hypothetical protein
MNAFEVWKTQRRLPVMTVEEYEEYERECSKVYEVPEPKMTPMGRATIKRGMTDRGERVDSFWEYVAIVYWRTVRGAVVERNKTDHLLYVASDGKVRKWFYDLRINGEPYEVKGRFKPDDFLKRDAHPDVKWIAEAEIEQYRQELNVLNPGWQDGFTQLIGNIPISKY